MYLVGVMSNPRPQEKVGPTLFISFLHGEFNEELGYKENNKGGSLTMADVCARG